MIGRASAAAPLPEGDALRQLMGLLEVVEHELDGLSESLERRLRDEVEASAPGGSVVVRGSAGLITEVRFEPRWAERAGTQEIAHWVLQLTREVHQRMWSDGGQDLPGGLNELRSLMADPARLLARLGLAAEPGDGQGS
ncbi:hypothetical protein ACFQZ8_03075 [Micromonospora azadirachtae]|uniref:YbaB/EbfC DNA-binding family protein n=1 Tax=Micromonospora azadirachtae TaxID=1970735 RepID=A0ABW2ZWA2_9ACTN